ncbi:hypothetical protein D1000_04295 [Riemerella anatipestifer]|nr:hypothetical protein [Riemerella anatipestifer]
MILPIFVGSIWCLSHATFYFHKYPLEALLFHQLNRLFGLGDCSVKKGYFTLFVLACLLVLCVIRRWRRLLQVQGLNFNRLTYS